MKRLLRIGGGVGVGGPPVGLSKPQPRAEPSAGISSASAARNDTTRDTAPYLPYVKERQLPLCQLHFLGPVPGPCMLRSLKGMVKPFSNSSLCSEEFLLHSCCITRYEGFLLAQPFTG